MYRNLKIMAAAAILFVAGCVEGPFPTGNPKFPAPDGAQVVSMCYHANATTREEVMSLAAKECDVEGSGVEFWHHDKMFNSCPIMAKTRVSFLCVPRK
tara:strand:- start:4415 stop:4708 length:294 start_codon:yes stop_codon:yes gene_type:complete